MPDPHANLSPPPPRTSPPPLPPSGLTVRPPAAPAPTEKPTNNQPIPAPPPQVVPELPAPPLPPALTATAPRSAAQIQRLTPVVEVWRASAHSPQIPARRGDHVAGALVADNRPVMVRLQFDPSARGQTVFVRPGGGTVLDQPSRTLRVNAVGECLVTLHLADTMNHGHVSFDCAGLITTLTLARNSQARVEANEALTPGGHR